MTTIMIMVCKWTWHVDQIYIIKWHNQAGNGTLQWRHHERNGVSNHQPHGCLLDRYSRRKLKKMSKLGVTGLCVGNSPVTGEFRAQRTSNAQNGSICWRHHYLGSISFRPVWISIRDEWNETKSSLEILTMYTIIPRTAGWLGEFRCHGVICQQKNPR